MIERIHKRIAEGQGGGTFSLIMFFITYQDGTKIAKIQIIKSNPLAHRRGGGRDGARPNRRSGDCVKPGI